MKTIRLLILTTLVAIGSISYAAVIKISGTVTNNGVAAAGITVIFTDSMSNISDTALSNSSGVYNISINTGSSVVGQMHGYITDCNRQWVYKQVNYTSSSTTYGPVDFIYCSTPPPASLSKVSGPVYTGTPLALQTHALRFMMRRQLAIAKS